MYTQISAVFPKGTRGFHYMTSENTLKLFGRMDDLP
jgi:hypothetical protein